MSGVGEGVVVEDEILQCDPQRLASPVSEWGKGVVVEGRMRKRRKGVDLEGLIRNGVAGVLQLLLMVVQVVMVVAAAGGGGGGGRSSLQW